MKSTLRTLALTAGLALASTGAQAALITINYSTAANAEDAFLNTLAGVTVTETFNGYDAGAGYITSPEAGEPQQKKYENISTAGVFNTAVGTFELLTAGQVNGNPEREELLIESKNTGEFGRQALSDGSDGDLWLDSNDAELVRWTLGAPLTGSFNAFGFYISDATDQGATLTLKFTNGTSAQVVLPAFNTDGNVGYITITSDTGVVGGVLDFINSNGKDGWGIDDITVGTVPEPGTLLLMGLGLLGLGAARRRNAA